MVMKDIGAEASLNRSLPPLEQEPQNMSQEKIEVSVVLPSMNEIKTIGICINKIKEVFKSEGIVGEIIVSDSSRDDTPVIAESLGAKVVKPDKRGYGYAYRYAFKFVQGDIVIIGDADNTYDFLEMPALLEPLRKGEADLVLGSRLKGKIEKGAMPWHHKRIGNPVLTNFLNLLFKAGVSDAHSGFRATTKKVLEELNLHAQGMEFASEMLVKAANKGFRIKEVPISYYKRADENSKLSSFSDGWRHLKFMLLNAPTYLFIYPGLFFMSIGMFLLFTGFFRINIGYVPGLHSMIAGSLFSTVGYQVMLFGFFANIYESKKLPRFFTLEKGATIGTLMCLVGLVFVLYMLYLWRIGGYASIAPLEYDIVGFVFIVLGLQTFFSSFMLSISANRKK